jgi:MinD-like ATPase involved in chromosome partitioning or flagellar assembly
MKVALLNNSGNVGKTTISREVLAVNMENPVLLEIETHNAGNESFKDYFSEYYKKSADEIDEIYEILAMNDEVVADVGASNMVEFFKKLSEYGIETIFDAMIIPVTSDVKQQKDTLKTISMLFGLNYPANKIFVIANRVKNLTTFDKDFKVLEEASKDIGFHFNKDLAIKETTIFRDLETFNKTLKDVLLDNTDYIKLAKENPEEKQKYIRLDLIKRGGKRLHEDLQKVFNYIQIKISK